MINVQELFFKHGAKSDNAFYTMMKDDEIQSVSYDADVDYPHLRLLCPKHKNVEKENEYVVNNCQKECNGLVIDIVTGQIITFIDHLGWYGSITELQHDPNPLYAMERGTVLRAGYDPTSQDWILSTNRKLNAERALFASTESFYGKIETFLSEKFQTWAHRELDPHYMYLFIFNDENGELPVSKTELVLAGMRERNTFSMVNLQQLIRVPERCRLATLLITKEEIENETTKGRGIISENEHGARIKYESIHYQKSYNLLQGAPVLSFFLQSYFENRKDIVKHLYSLFPNKIFAMSILQEWGRVYVRYIWNWYHQLKVKKGPGRLSPMSLTLSIIHQLHHLHVSQKTVVTLEVIQNWLVIAFAKDANVYLGHILHLVEEKTLIKKPITKE